MRKLLTKYPLHTFLFIILICLFLFAHNYGQVEIFMMKRTLVAGTVFSICLFGIIYFFIRNRIKTGIICTLLLLLLFNYGVLYDALEALYFSGFWPFNNIHRYLIGFTFLASVIIIYLVHKKIAEGFGINYILNILVLILIIFNGIKIFNFYTKYHTPESAHNNIVVVNPNKQLPNLYYIILDGYANQHTLKKYYDYDNSDFINFLKTNQFFVADSSISNYYSTPPSLAATMNMDYLPQISGAEIRKHLLHNKFLSILKGHGYTLYNLQSGYSVTNGFSEVDSTIVINGPNEFERGILKFTIFRLDDLFGMIQHTRLKSQFEKLATISRIQKKQRFIFVHIVAPHPPFVFNSQGKHVYNDKHSDNSWEPKKNYVEQLMYVNKIMKTFISQIITNDKSGVIILQSDHGPWIQSQDEDAVFEARSMILNAMRYPGRKDTIFNRSVSSVNTFRFFIKEYIDSSFTLLKDSAAGREEIMMNRLFIDRTK